MKIHEYQAKDIFLAAGVPVPPGYVAFSVQETIEAVEKLGGNFWVVKAQIHAGGRGKGGGVRFAHSVHEVREHAEALLGMQLKTHQTGPGGQKVRRLYVTGGVQIAREIYLGLVLDRERSQVVIMASSEGGVEIEKVAAETPELIYKEWIDPGCGLMPFQIRSLAFKLGLEKVSQKGFGQLLRGLVRIYNEKDCSLLEVNPLVVTPAGEVIALDAKINFDGSALYRHPDIEKLRDLDEEDPLEIRASKFDLNYIKLDGTVGCMVNGAGLAMATMDILKQYGAEPANFLDVGGGATEDKVTEAFKILVDDKVQAIFVNIFNNIMKCDVIANGVVNAARQVGLRVPLIVRLEGTNVAEGKAILAASGLAITTAESMKDGAQKAAQAVGV
ncbi:MAG TPA: ADP-forming succinate--CoA ligase subunit beta [Myxococcales bacterium]|nr:ADP-forming succinate--CoA ligase subunit beta [Myxococcales bacterium]